MAAGWSATRPLPSTSYLIPGTLEPARLGAENEPDESRNAESKAKADPENPRS